MDYFESLDLRRKLIYGFSVPLALIVLISATVYFSLNRLLESSRWVNHTHEAIELGSRITQSLINMETGLRGYLVAGKEEFLEPYYKGQEDYLALIEQTKQKVSDNPAQVARLEEIERIQAKWLAEHVHVAMGFREEVTAGAAAAANFKKISARIVGKQKFDGFRAEMAKLDQRLSQAGSTEGQTLIKSILIDMINQETGQRGFLLSGQEASLEPYVMGIKSFDIHIQQMQQVINQLPNNESLNRNLNMIVELAKGWRLEAAEPEIQARREMNKVTRSMVDVTAFIEQGIGKKYMDAMRALLDEFIDEEATLIVIRNEDQKTTAYITEIVTIFGALFALAAGFFITVHLTRMVLVQLGEDPVVLGEIAEQIADGNLDVPIDSNHATGVLKSMAGMKANLIARRDSDIQIQNEIDVLVSAAAKGDFTKAIDLEGKEGVFLEVSLGLNTFVKTCDEGLKDVSRVLSALANGDLTQKIEANYSGAFEELKEHANNTVQQIEGVLGEIATLVNAANSGDFKASISMSQKPGFFGELSASLNQLIDTTNQGLQDVLRILGALAEGDLSQSIEADYQGAFLELKEYSNNTILQINEVMGEIGTVVQAANRGNFKVAINLDGKSGFFRDFSESLNELVDTIDNGLEDVLQILSAFAEGNMGERISSQYEGAFAQLKDDANTTAEKLTEVINKIKAASDSVSGSSSEISQGNSELSGRTEQQASALEETASSMEEMISIIKESEFNANHANQLSVDAYTKASEGGEVVEKAIVAMDEINTASNKIADIIGVIDEIAFQTNLLALNAAVEAARAGEQGRGFAVVASEVRSLAQRSASAAKEIKDLIQDSVQKVEDGSDLVNTSGETLREIVEAVRAVSTTIESIATAAAEQSSGIQQVNSAISQMDQMTQQNAALAQQTSVAGESMAQEASVMKSTMSFFRT